MYVFIRTLVCVLTNEHVRTVFSASLRLYRPSYLSDSIGLTTTHLTYHRFASMPRHSRDLSYRLLLRF